VYGSFGRAGKFECRADVEVTKRATDPGPSTRSVRVSFDKVAYHPEYQGLSYQQLLREVRRRLMTDNSHGEI
jgi:hypothetical protein